MPKGPNGTPVYYQDTGCEISKLCQLCPLPRCRYEEPNGIRSAVNAPRNAQIIEARSLGVPTYLLTEHFGISLRQFRHITQVTA